MSQYGQLMCAYCSLLMLQKSQTTTWDVFQNPEQWDKLPTLQINAGFLVAINSTYLTNYMGVSKNSGTPIKIDNLEVPLFSETSTAFYLKSTLPKKIGQSSAAEAWYPSVVTLRAELHPVCQLDGPENDEQWQGQIEKKHMKNNKNPSCLL